MTLKKRKLVGGFNRYRLILTLGVAVLLPAAGLIYVNFSQLREFERDNFLEAAIHRDFQEFLAISEKELNKKAYGMVDDAREQFPTADASVDEKEQKLDEILSHCSCFLHLFVFDAEKGIVLRTQPNQLDDEYVQEEHESAMDAGAGAGRECCRQPAPERVHATRRHRRTACRTISRGRRPLGHPGCA